MCFRVLLSPVLLSRRNTRCTVHRSQLILLHRQANRIRNKDSVRGIPFLPRLGMLAHNKWQNTQPHRYYQPVFPCSCLNSPPIECKRFLYILLIQRLTLHCSKYLKYKCKIQVSSRTVSWLYHSLSLCIFAVLDKKMNYCCLYYFRLQILIIKYLLDIYSISSTWIFQKEIVTADNCIPNWSKCFQTNNLYQTLNVFSRFITVCMSFMRKFTHSNSTLTTPWRIKNILSDQWIP